MKNTKPANRSKETTISGIVGAIIIILGQLKFGLDGDPLTEIDWNAISGAIVMGFGLWRARDANKSSEESGVKEQA